MRWYYIWIIIQCKINKNKYDSQIHIRSKRHSMSIDFEIDNFMNQTAGKTTRGRVRNSLNIYLVI
jgi:hypothetical protein